MTHPRTTATRAPVRTRTRETRLTACVVVCAYTEDRWDDVLAAVASVQAQEPPPDEIVVVVDHNPALLARLRERLEGAPALRVVENAAERGLSGGKNTGVAAATSDVVVFLDDDAVAGPGWLRALLAAYVDDRVLGVGGLTLPAWTTSRPAWWPAEFDWVVGCTFTGRDPGVVRNLLGGNASFRRDLFELAGGFPPHIGRTASGRPLGCEETEFCIRAAARAPGGRFVFDAGAVIHHRVPAARERFAYFRSRCYAEGLSKALVTASVGVRSGLAAERTYAAVALRRGALRGLREAFGGDPAGLLRSGAIAVGLLWTAVGYGVGALQGARRPRRRG